MLVTVVDPDPPKLTWMLAVKFTAWVAPAVHNWLQMPLGIFSAKGVLPLEFKPAHSVGELLTQHLDELEQEAGHKIGVLQALDDHFARVYQLNLRWRCAA